MGDDPGENLPVPDDLAKADTVEAALESAAAIGSLVPLLGGVIQGVLSGMSIDRKLQRLVAVLNDLQTRLNTLEAGSEEYLKSDEFGDLVEKTLRQAAEESSEEKRSLYAEFLAGIVEEPVEPYDQRRLMLRTLDELEPAEVLVLRTLAMPYIQADPDAPPGTLGAMASPPFDTTWSEENSLALEHLATMGLVTVPDTPRNSRRRAVPRLTDYGRKFIAFVLGV
jgi:hypothetical protein